MSEGNAEQVWRVARLKLSPRARTDLEEIWLYGFQTWSAEQADRYHAMLVAALEGLGDGSRIDSPVDVREGYSKTLAGSHVVYFQRRENLLVVVRILHQRMDVNRHLPKL